MDLWIPIFIGKPFDKQLVLIKLSGMTVLEGIYDHNDATWKDVKGDKIKGRVVAWKKKDGEINVRPEFGQPAIC